MDGNANVSFGDFSQEEARQITALSNKIQDQFKGNGETTRSNCHFSDAFKHNSNGQLNISWNQAAENEDDVVSMMASDEEIDEIYSTNKTSNNNEPTGNKKN